LGCFSLERGIAQGSVFLMAQRKVYRFVTQATNAVEEQNGGGIVGQLSFLGIGYEFKELALYAFIKKVEPFPL
jgi:hypothetical protein